MMNRSYIFFFAILIAFSSVAFAQHSNKSNRENWLKNIQKYKHEMLAKETEMTKTQQSDFFPLYSAMEKEVYQVNKDAHSLESDITNSKTAVSDSEYEKAASALSDIKTKEAQIESFYFSKFEKILTKKQLFLLKRAEGRFARNMLDHNKRGQAAKQ